MSCVVMKFGGTSVANVERIRNVARHVKREVDAGNKVAVVVSAMAGATNQLVAWVREAAPLHDAREYDAVVATGEARHRGPARHRAAVHGHAGAIVAGLANSRSSPTPPMASRASAIFPARRSCARLEQGEVAVITGFQGIEPERNRISTLGRGGSDTSAVAIAVAVKADLCDIYTDVDGVYTTDPAHRPEGAASAQGVLRGDAGDGVAGLQGPADALGRAGHGTQDARAGAVELRPARQAAAGSPTPGTRSAPSFATRMRSWSSRVVSGIAYAKDEAKITLLQDRRQARHRGQHLRPAGRGQHQRRHDRAEPVRRRQIHRHDLHGAGVGAAARAGGPEGRSRRTSAPSRSRAPATSPRCP